MFVKFLISLVIISLFFSKPVYSSENFKTNYDVVYEINNTGITNANFSVTLTNTTPQYFASSYKMIFGFDDITNLKAFDAEGEIETSLKKTNDGSEIELIFNKKPIGIGSSLTFNLEFETKNIVQKYGNVWEVNIPGVSDIRDFDEYFLEVKTPPSFGKPIFIKPEHGGEKLKFDKNQIGNSGISMTFGDKQVIDFSLEYDLQNSNFHPIKSQIALPPSTNYQTVFITQMEPKPNNVILDFDGNWIAEYSLKKGTNKKIKVKGQAVINLSPKNVKITEKEKNEYTKSKSSWQTSNNEVVKLAEKLKTPEAIYNYVVEYLSYDFSGINSKKERLGAVKSLKNPDKAVCREFTDLFIAIARAAEIPAREINGYANTNNSSNRPLSLVEDVLHAWPEYYDYKKKTWVMVDPTWGSTTGGVDYFHTLDINHFTFVRKGTDDNYPIPAGGYKSAAVNSKKYININFSEKIPEYKSSSDIRTSINNTHIAGIPLTTEITVTNTGSGFIPPQVLSLSSDKLEPVKNKFDIAGIPPFGRIVINAKFEPTDPLTNMDAGFKISYSDKIYNQDVKIAPFYMTLSGIGGILIVLFTIITIIFATKTWGLRISK